MNTNTVLFYTSGNKPFVQRFYEAHLEQANRLNLGFSCISLNKWNNSLPYLVKQRERQSTVQYTGIFEGILQGLEGLSDDCVVFLAEDDCLYDDFRFDKAFIDVALTEPDRMFYQLTVTFISPEGFYTPKVNGLCLHSAFGTVSAIRHNIHTKLLEFKGEREFPASSVEPCSYPSRQHPDPANKVYKTSNINTPMSLSLDFRGYDDAGQTWKPDGTESTWQDDKVWGQAKSLWDKMINGTV